MPDSSRDSTGSRIVIETPASRVRDVLTGSFAAGSVVVLTPIPSIQKRFMVHGWEPVKYRGWWPRFSLGNAHVVLIPQGSAAIDLCVGLADASRVDLLGYAGSLRDSVGVGEVLRPGATTLLGASDPPTPMRGAGDCIVVTVPNLLATYENAERVTSFATLADMECAHIAKTLERHGGPTLRAHLLVTDRWPDVPFYRTDAGSEGQLRMDRNAMVDSFVEELR